MRLVVIDTNVIVSAALTPAGTPGTIINEWVLETRIQAVTSPAVIQEYREVTSKAKFLPYGFPPRWLEVLIGRSLYLPDSGAWAHPLPDPDDEPFLALAHQSDAWLVTGNLKHYATSSRAGVIVLSPADYLEHLERGDKPRR